MRLDRIFYRHISSAGVNRLAERGRGPLNPFQIPSKIPFLTKSFLDLIHIMRVKTGVTFEGSSFIGF
jgi:hypothetical protein